MGGVGAEQRRPALPAEPFLAAALRPPDTKPVLARDDPERLRRRMRLRRGRRTSPPLAAPAVAVARAHERLADLVTNCPAVAAARERKLHLTMMTRGVVARCSSARSSSLTSRNLSFQPAWATPAPLGVDPLGRAWMSFGGSGSLMRD